MRFKLFWVRTLVVCAALVAGMAVGTLGYGLASAGPYPNQSFAPPPVYPRNENGQTYGALSAAISVETEPDLVKAVGVDGTVGYVLSKDLDGGPMPKTPEEALTRMRNTPSIRPIPLYDIDGKTVIGVFNVQAGKSIEIPKGSR